MIRRSVSVTGGVLAVAGTLLWAARSNAPHRLADVPTARSADGPHSDERTPQPAVDDARSHAFRVPSGRAPALTCEAARAIVAQARAQLGYAPDSVDATSLADAAADWLDPYGLWSVAPDAPLAASFDRHAADLLAALEGPRSRD